MLLGFGAAIHTGTLIGAQGAMFHVVNHGLMKSLAFMAAGCFLFILHATHGDHDTLVADDLYGAAGRYPFAALAFSLALLSLGGMPPLAGFMSKWQIFVACFESGNAWIGGLAVFGALNSVLSLGYYAPLINKMYRKAPSAVVENDPESLPLSMLVPLGLMVLAVVAIGLYPVLLDWLSMPSGASLMAAFGG
jgi:NADH:ubiquinone oxidoreductase subunit 2 (subunit N)